MKKSFTVLFLFLATCTIYAQKQKGDSIYFKDGTKYFYNYLGSGLGYAPTYKLMGSIFPQYNSGYFYLGAQADGQIRLGKAVRINAFANYSFVVADLGDNFGEDPEAYDEFKSDFVNFGMEGLISFKSWTKNRDVPVVLDEKTVDYNTTRAYIYTQPSILRKSIDFNLGASVVQLRVPSDDRRLENTDSMSTSRYKAINYSSPVLSFGLSYSALNSVSYELDGGTQVQTTDFRFYANVLYAASPKVDVVQVEEPVNFFEPVEVSAASMGFQEIGYRNLGFNIGLISTTQYISGSMVVFGLEGGVQPGLSDGPNGFVGLKIGYGFGKKL